MKRLFLATILSTLAILSGGKAMAQFFAGGSGTQNDPYLIATAEQFNKMGGDQDSNTTQGKYYKQTADLTFNNNNETKFKEINFSGYYDGQGFSIKSSKTQGSTLFNEISGGKVKNLVIYRVTVSESQPTSGGLLCRKFSSGQIENITVTNCTCFTMTNNDVDKAVPSGGLIGIMSGGRLSNCCVKGTTITSREVAGGLVGQMTGGTVEYSSFTGDTVSAEFPVTSSFTKPCCAGGIVGMFNNGTIKACYALGTVQINSEESDSYACGIAGNYSNLDNSANISNCYNGTGKPAVNSNLQNDTTNVISQSDGLSAQDIVNTLNDGLNSPAFVVENGKIVHMTAADGGVYESKASGGRFGDESTWRKIELATSPKYIIKSGTSVSIEDGDILPEGIGIEVEYKGNLINKTNNAVRASLENKILNGWNCIGFPVKGESNLAPLAASDAPDIWALAFDYDTNNWSKTYLHFNETTKDNVQAGNGIMAFVNREYRFNVEGETVNESLTVTNNVTGSDSAGRWMALANPYPAGISAAAVAAFADNSTQGKVIYVHVPNGSGSGWDVYSSEDEIIPAGRGFMVNMPAGTNSFTFDKNMIKGYSNSPAAKSAVAKREFLTVSVSTNGYKVPVMFAKNEAAREDYDIFDANKLFGDGSLAEPYLLCKGINLCKEEVNTLPYTATMNIKSGEAQSVEIIAENIPEGYSLVLLDGEEEIAMNQGDIYTVNIASGENADRFKLKIGEKNVSITDVEKVADLSIRNNNRNIIIEGGKNIRAEVYNTLGQKVYETTARNFNIEGVAAGAYVIKVQSGKAVQSQKVIIR